MRSTVMAWAVRLIALLMVIAAAFSQPAGAQRSQRGQPKTPFSTTDFQKLHWLEGTWEATSAGESSLFEQIRFTSDSTIEISYHADSPSGRETGTGRLYLSVGRIYYTLGSGRWGATTVDSAGVFFVPQVNAHNTFAWTTKSPDAWSSTMRSAVGGRERVVVYEMRRIGR